jgi:hypothetical protein
MVDIWNDQSQMAIEPKSDSYWVTIESSKFGTVETQLQVENGSRSVFKKQKNRCLIIFVMVVLGYPPFFSVSKTPGFLWCHIDWRRWPWPFPSRGRRWEIRRVEYSKLTPMPSTVFRACLGPKGRRGDDCDRVTTRVSHVTMHLAEVSMMT